MNLDDAQERSLAAAEYVLGTLEDADRAEVSARIETDAALRADIYFWQDQLLPLASRVGPVEPEARLWPAIAERTARSASAAAEMAAPSALTPPTGAPPLRAVPAPQAAANDPLWRSLRRWRATALTAMAASFVFASLLVLRPAEQPVRYITLLQAPDTQRTGWVVETITGDRIRLVPIDAAGAVPSGKSVQFWTKPDGAQAPTSLGLVRPGAPVELPVARSPGVGAQQLFELTLEPEGGSPTGLPTGPILYVGRSVRL